MTGESTIATAEQDDSHVPVIHAVTNDQILLRQDFLERAGQVMESLGGSGAVHVRSRLLPSTLLCEIASALVRLQGVTGSWCVLNDRVDIALASGALAVQLTGNSMSVADARIVGPKLRIGGSVHTAAEAVEMDRDGADWCVAGNVFETETHPGQPRRESDFITAIARAASIPVIAIGGVAPEHVQTLVGSGAYGVASIRGIWDAENSGHAAASYLSAYDGTGTS